MLVVIKLFRLVVASVCRQLFLFNVRIRLQRHVLEDRPPVCEWIVYIVGLVVVDHEVAEKAQLLDGYITCLLHVVYFLLFEYEVSNLLWKVF